jgi:hypothetical protein
MINFVWNYGYETLFIPRCCTCSVVRYGFKNASLNSAAGGRVECLRPFIWSRVSDLM